MGQWFPPFNEDGSTVTDDEPDDFQPYKPTEFDDLETRAGLARASHTEGADWCVQFANCGKCGKRGTYTGKASVYWERVRDGSHRCADCAETDPPPPPSKRRPDPFL